MSLLEVKGISKHFGGVTAVDKVSFCIDKGMIASIIGPNGAGKTTLFNLITGFTQPDEGKIIFDGKEMTKISPEIAAQSGIARTFQNIRLFPDLLVIENILIGMHIHLKAGLREIIFQTTSVRKEEEKAKEEALALLNYVGLEGKEGILAKNLPYGEQRKLEIARALALKPKLLILDEPAAGMNPKETQELIDFILKLRDECHITILLIEHDMKVVMNISDYVTVLDYGVKIAEGLPSEIKTNKEVIKAYLGDETI